MKTTLLALSLLVVGCAAQVRYVPQSPAGVAEPAKFVRLEVVDARPAGQGGDDPRAVGIVRGGYGNPMTFRQPLPADVTRLVHEASADALRGASVSVRPDATTRVVARVLRFWMDGYVGYGAHVEVEYLIVDDGKLPRWGARARGDASGAIFTFGAASRLLSTALAQLASNAVPQFRSPTFQSVVR